MAISTGDSVAASTFNALFTTLNSIRAKQYARNDVTSSNLSSAWTGPAVVGANPVPSDIQSFKTKVGYLESGVSNISGFSSSISIPSVGDLLKASTITTMETVVSGLSSECVDCTFNSSFNASFNSSFNASFNSSFNSSFSTTCFSNWGSNCSWF